MMLTWKAFDSANTPTVRNLKPRHSRGQVITKKRWITFPKEPTIVLKILYFIKIANIALEAKYPPPHYTFTL
jgi:hypothetical protein